MIALDTSALRRAFHRWPDAFAAIQAMRSREAILPPVVVTEALSDPFIPPGLIADILITPMLAIHDGYWQRAGELRAFILRDKLRAYLPDSLIAQSCIDHDIPLITYDRDFRHFEKAGLKLV